MTKDLPPEPDLPESSTQERWRLARDIFEDGLELGEAARRDLIAERCGSDAELRRQVEELFGWHQRADGFISQPLFSIDPGGEAEGSGAASLEGHQVGAYRLGRQIGEGGMGVVHLAERADDSYRKEVAVKLLRGDARHPTFAARFLNERQILADLEHPNIARLLDGGTDADGRPFLVMEYVDGVSIDTYCTEQGLDVDARLRLVLEVAAAVSYAHRRLIVHRDLKPSNILITAGGQPKLLDFGIAKLLDAEAAAPSAPLTQSGQMLMTPDYASPEQVSGDSLGAASDIYSLGVILFELLTGRSPYALKSRRLEEVIRAIGEGEPPRPSTAVGRPLGGDGARVPAAPPPGDPQRLRRRLAGDVDAIILKALRKEPEERYASADRLIFDIERHLAGRPITARRDSFAYRCAKFLRRHRWAVAASTLALATLLGLLVALAAQRRALLDQQEQLVRQRNRAEAVSGLLTEVFSMPDPSRSQGERVTARDLLDRGVDQIERELGTEPEERADLLLTMGRSYLNLGLLQEAAPLLGSAVDTRRRQTRPEPALLAESLSELAHLHSLEGRYPQGLAAAEEAVALLRDAPQASRRTLAMALAHQGRALERTGDLAAAEASFVEALDLARQEGHPPTLAAVLGRFAILLSERARFDRAEAMYRETLALWLGLRGEASPEVALVRNNLGLVLMHRGAFEDARAQLLNAEAAQRRLYEEPHPHLATTLGNLGLLATAAGRYEEAEERFREALELGRTAYEGDHPKLAEMLHNFGDLEAARGRHGEAEMLYRQALESRRELLGESHPDSAATLNNLARMLRAQGSTEEAKAAFESALHASLTSLGDDHPQIAVVLNNLAEIHHGEGNLERAGELYRKALEIGRSSLGPGHPDLAPALHNLAALEQKSGRLEEAETLYAEALTVMTRSLGDAHLNVAMTRTSLASLKNRLGDFDGAEELSRLAMERLEAELPVGSPWRVAARRVLARSLQELGEEAEAEELLQAARRRVIAELGESASAAKSYAEALAALDRSEAASPDSSP